MNTYIVKHGDTLQSIALKFFGDPTMAQYLASINGIAGYPGVASGFYYIIHPGQVINVGVAEVEGKRIWPWAVGAGVLAAIVFRKRISSFLKSF